MGLFQGIISFKNKDVVVPLYNSFVQLHLGNAVQFWSPYHGGTLLCNGSTLGSQPRGNGFDPRAEWKNLGCFSDTPTPLFT